MVNRIESFSSIEEEEEALVFFNDTFKKELVNVARVVYTVLSPQEAFLRGVYHAGNGRHDRVSYGGG